MIKEHDRIVLTEPVPAEGLEVGDVGTVVHVYADGNAFEVEFTTLDGKAVEAKDPNLGWGFAPASCVGRPAQVFQDND